MVLGEFIEKFVCKNSLVRLWAPCKGGHKMLVENDQPVCMEWEILKGKVWQSKYINFEVEGVTHTCIDDGYKESVNIVLKEILIWWV